MAIMQDGKEMVDLQINGRMIESAKINDRYVYPDSLFGNDFVIEVNPVKLMDNLQSYSIVICLSYGEYTIDWGDGVLDKYEYYDNERVIEKVYDNLDEHIIRINGYSSGVEIMDNNLVGVLNFGSFGTSYIKMKSNISLTYVDCCLTKYHKKLTKLRELFMGCENLEYVKKGFFNECNDLIDISYAFKDCIKFNTTDDSIFLNNKNLINISYCFYNCISLSGEITNTMFGYNNRIQYFICSFAYCSNITGIGESFFENLPAVLSYSKCFYYAFKEGITINNLLINIRRRCDINLMFAYSNISGISNLNIVYNNLYINYNSPIFPLSPGSEMFIGSLIEYCTSISIICSDSTVKAPTFHWNIFEFLNRCDRLKNIGNIKIEGFGEDDNIVVYFSINKNLEYVGNINIINTKRIDLYIYANESLASIGNVTSHYGDIHFLTHNNKNLESIGVITCGSVMFKMSGSPKMETIITEGGLCYVPIQESNIKNVYAESVSVGFGYQQSYIQNIHTNNLVSGYCEGVVYINNLLSVIKESPKREDGIGLWSFFYTNYTKQEVINAFRNKGWRLQWQPS